jgi:hypothetical protein
MDADMIRFLLLSLCCFSAAVAAPVSLKDGDLVVLLGDTFVEREGNYGFIEATITASNPGKTIRFRNLGWSGDTPNAQARSYFGPPAEGQQRLKGNLELVKPTMVFCAYGSAIAAEGEAGIGKFIADYGKLIDLISQTTKSQIVLVSPAPAEAKGVVKPLMDVRNSQLAAVAGAVKKLAEERKLGYIDLLTPLTKVIAEAKTNLTTNGLHFTEAGYEQIAPMVAAALVELPKPAGVVPVKLRTAIREKNELFFNRWRPQNEIYLFGSRKHEQGNNGVEIPMFDPLIEAKEKEIAGLQTQPQS